LLLLEGKLGNTSFPCSTSTSAILITTSDQYVHTYASGNAKRKANNHLLSFWKKHKKDPLAFLLGSCLCFWEGKIATASFLLGQSQARFQQEYQNNKFILILLGRTASFPSTQEQGKLAIASFPSSTRTSAMPTTTSEQ